MANFWAIHSVGDSLINFLRNTYPEPLRSDHPCEFRLISSSDLAEDQDMGTAVTLYLYRVEIDEHQRQRPHPGNSLHPLSLSLYYLMIIWADSALAEHVITAWIMSQLHQHPILDNSILSNSGSWAPGDQVSVLPVEMKNEDLMRLWDALTPTYRLSLPYMVRVIHIDPEEIEDSLPVVARRFYHGEVMDEDETD
ncbi:Pvc16 family protein [Desulfobacter sp.]